MRIDIILLGLLPLFVLASEEDIYPLDVSSFVERRDSCDHFRGEVGYDEERIIYLVQKMNELCVGSDKNLAFLKNKYEEDRQVIEKLSEYDAEIEP